MSAKKYLSSVIEKIMDYIILNPFIKFYFSFKIKYVAPRISKIEGVIAARKVKFVGKDFKVHGSAVFEGVNNLHVGDYVRIGKGAYFNCMGGLYIEDNVQISRNVLIYTASHNINSSTIPYDKSYIHKPVRIGKSVWIGMNVIIVPGTIIQDGAIIGMGTVVSGLVPKGAIVVGSKQRIVGYRDIDDFDKNTIDKKYFGLLFPKS